MTKRFSSKKKLAMFWIFLKIGAFTLGGGFAMIPLIKMEIVDKQKWIKEEEFLDIIAVTQSAPGAVAINVSMYIGYKIAGVLGAIIATIGTMLPSFIIILVIAFFYTDIKSNVYIKKIFKGVYPAIVSLILFAAINLKKTAVDSLGSFFIVALSLFALLIFDIHPILIIVFSGIINIFLNREKIEEDSRGVSK